jgi:hypothetical protein
MDQTERFGSPAAYPLFRRHFLHQGLDGMITGRLNIMSIRKEHPGHRRPLRAGERMTPGQVRRWVERASGAIPPKRRSADPSPFASGKVFGIWHGRERPISSRRP